MQRSHTLYCRLLCLASAIALHSKPAKADAEASARQRPKASLAQAEPGKAAKKQKRKTVPHAAGHADQSDQPSVPFEAPEPSARERSRKPVSLFYDTGVSDGVTQFGGEINYALTPHEVLGLRGLTSSGNIIGVKQSVTSLALTSRTFFGNSFYLLLTGGVRQFSVTHPYSDDSATAAVPEAGSNGTTVLPSDENSFTALQATGEIGVGNRWQFAAGWSIGCDWVTYSLPLALLSLHSKYGSIPQSEDSKSAALDDFKTTISGGSLTVIRLHIGWAF